MKPQAVLLSSLILLSNSCCSLASNLKEVLDRRQSCPYGDKECGASYCIPISYSCCPDGVGCPPGQYCSLGDNGEYGCCPNDEICTGNGGASTTGTYYYTSTYTENSYPTTAATATTTAAATGAIPTCNDSPVTATDGAVYSVLCDTDFLGASDGSNVLGSPPHADALSDCVELCEGTTDCVAVDFYAVDRPGYGPAGTCYLLSNTNSGDQKIAGESAATRISGPTTSTPDLSAAATSANPGLSSGVTAGATGVETASSASAGNLSPPRDGFNGHIWAVSAFVIAVTGFLAMIWL